MNSYQGNSGLVTNSGPLAYVLGKGMVPQILFAVLICTLIYIFMMAAEIVYLNFRHVAAARVPLVTDMTGNDLTISDMEEIEQNPTKPKHKMLPMSDNERTGSEFSYTFFLWVNPKSFRQEEGLLHVFHKGYKNPYPLMCPGVFMLSHVNTLRVYVNASTTWNKYVDIENIPISKWVHIGIVAQGGHVSIYVNGNIAKKLNLEGAVIYQNFQNVFVLDDNTKCSVNSMVPSLKGQPFTVFGALQGKLSRLHYFNYALSYTELQAEVDQGPSPYTKTSTEQTPPYLRDNWWVASAYKD